jgi:hypothetical protein
MRRNLTIAFVGLAVVIGGWFLLFSASEGPNAAEMARLRQRDAKRRAAVQEADRRSKTDLALLWEQGRGQELPEYLVSEIDREGNFWFVGKPDSVAGVQIPFAPGRLPLPPADTEPLSPNPGFLGAEACRDCHADKHKSFIETAHHRTTRLALPDEVAGSFEEGSNRMNTSDPNVFFTMKQRGDDLYQSVQFFDWGFEVPFHIIIGSSKMAESYLYWHGDQLFQMNCTHLTDRDEWINSPGFIDGDAIYARPIRSGCLDCHVTYVDYRKSANHYTPKSMILGISCERCHGPGKQHVDYHVAHPDVKESKYMQVPSKLSRQAQMDVCGQCHTTKKAPIHEQAFQFRPGDKLSDHYETIEGKEESLNSVHTSNQVGRLSLSQCFQKSEMGCVECHDPHRNERGNFKLFSQRCLECHQQEHCGMEGQLGDRLAENCIDCHMPVRASKNLQVETGQGNIFPPLRDHYIRVDQEATDQFLKQDSN